MEVKYLISVSLYSNRFEKKKFDIRLAGLWAEFSKSQNDAG